MYRDLLFELSVSLMIKRAVVNESLPPANKKKKKKKSQCLYTIRIRKKKKGIFVC